MKIGVLFTAAFIGLAALSCKHEIIPAPEQRVDLKFHFQGTMRGSFVEFTQNVDGFDLEANKIKTILPNTFSRATYYSYIKSNQKAVGIKLLIGEALWDGSQSDNPDVNIFTDLFKNNTQPVFNTGGKEVVLLGVSKAGFDVEYKDVNGNIWAGDPSATNTLEFTYLKQESDKTGDYMNYIAKMNVTLKRTWWNYVYDNLGIKTDSTQQSDSFTITDGVMQGWFKR
jgi:hypothetical protein